MKSNKNSGTIEGSDYIESARCDTRCKGDCPPFLYSDGRRFCCGTCFCTYTRHIETVEATKDRRLVEKRWDEKVGFLGPKGCKLPRRLMPKYCRDFHCKNMVFFTIAAWDPQRKNWRRWVKAIHKNSTYEQVHNSFTSLFEETVGKR